MPKYDTKCKCIAILKQIQQAIDCKATLVIHSYTQPNCFRLLIDLRAYIYST